MELHELATRLKGQLHPTTDASETFDVKGIAAIADAKPGEITFLANADYEEFLKTTKASAVILATHRPELRIAQIVHKNPYWAFAKTSQMFHQPRKPAPGVAREAFVADGATVDPTATVMPLAYIGKGARIGKDVVIYPGAFVGDGVEIGEGSEIRANVVIERDIKIGKRVLIHGNSTIGADGFGFAPGEGELAKIPQVGSVVIGDDVEIGGCVTVDRGSLEDTRLGRGTKLDSHVHIGHGAVLGENCMFCGLAGVAGSAKIGNWVVAGGHSAINNRCDVPDGTQLGAMSAMTSSPEAKGTYIGFPAMPAGEWRRQAVMMRKLPEMEKRLKALEAKLGKS